MVKTIIQGEVIYTSAHSNGNTLNQLFLEIGATKLESLVPIVTRTNFREEFLPYTCPCRRCLCQYGFYADSRLTSTKTWIITTLDSIFPNAKGSQWSEQFKLTEGSGRTCINSADSKQSVLATHKLNTTADENSGKPKGNLGHTSYSHMILFDCFSNPH